MKIHGLEKSLMTLFSFSVLKSLVLYILKEAPIRIAIICENIVPYSMQG